MESFLKSLSNFLIALIILAVVGVAIVLIYFDSPISAAKQQLNQQLSQIDVYFSTPRVHAQDFVALLPEYVGKFERTSVKDTATPECAKNPTFPIKCISTFYRKSDESDKSFLEFNIWANGSSLQTVDDRAFSFSCGDVVIGTNLRTVGSLPYRYHIVCSATLFGSPSLGGIIWQNDSWFLSVKGDYDDMTQFIAAYPY